MLPCELSRSPEQASFPPGVPGSLSVLSDSTGSPKVVLVRPVRGGKPPGKQAQQQKGTVDPATSSLVLNWSFQRYMMMC